LSKNGFNVVLDQTLFNNSGSLPELAKTILQDTDWEVDVDNSNICYQTVEESLICLTLTSDIQARQIIDPDENTTYSSNAGDSIISATFNPIPSGEKIYAFYSSCKGRPYRFQFLYVDEKNKEYLLDKDSIVINKNCQYVIDIEDIDTTYTENTIKGYYLPNWCDPSFSVSSTMRGKRYVFSQKSKFNPLLNSYVYECNTEGNIPVYMAEETEYVNVKSLINLCGNSDFSTTAGWTPQVYSSNKQYTESI
jgi:hypothetical protein